MISKYFRAVFIFIILFAFTSSCVDKKSQSYGELKLTFDYRSEIVIDNSDQDNNDNESKNQFQKTKHNYSFEQKEPLSIERPKLDIDLDVVIDNDNDLIKPTETLKQDYCCARIKINNGTPITLDLNSQNTYSRTLPIGSVIIEVDLLTFSNIVLYSAVKNVQVAEDVLTSVNFLPDDWVVQNQIIEITSNFSTSYDIGEEIDLTWTNTHTARGVKIEMTQNVPSNVIKVFENNFIGNSYTINTNNESPKSNIGLTVKSTMNETSYNRCCFSIVANNEAPTVENINETIDEDQSIEIQFDGNDADGDNISYSILSNPSSGTLGSINNDKIIYSPNQDFNGTDLFTYRANDGTEDSNTATVTITIQAVNDAPTTNDVSSTIDENRNDRVADLTLDGNDIDGDDLTYSLLTSPSNGSVSINGNILTYNADQDWNGIETFTYKANDGQLDSNVSNITITVTPVNDPPTTGDDISNYSLHFGGSARVQLPSGFFDNIGEPNSSFSISMWVRQHPNSIGSDGTLISGVASPNYYLPLLTLRYDSTIDFYHDGPEGQYYDKGNIPLTVNEWNHVVYVSDGDQGFNVLFVNNVVDVVESFCTGCDLSSSPKDWNLGSWGGNNFDGKLDDVAIWNTALTSDDVNTLYNNGELKAANSIKAHALQAYYNFEQGNGSTISDISGNNNQASIIGSASYDESTPSPQTPYYNVTTDEDLFVDIDLSEFITDVDGDDLNFQIVTGPEYGSASFVSNSVLRYMPDTNYYGQDSFSFNANDSIASSGVVAINLTINPINDAPTTGGGKTYSTPNDQSLVIVLEGDDIDGDALSYEIEEITTSGANLSLDGNIVTYTPISTPSTNVRTLFRYKVSDGIMESEQSTIIVWMTANEFTNPVDGQFWKKGNSELIEWTEDFSEAVGLYLVKGEDYQNAITITDAVQGRNHSYNIPSGLDTDNNYRILLAQSVSSSFPNGLYHFSDYFTINDNSPPISNDQTITGSINTDLDFTLTASDDGSNLTYIIIEQPQFGVISGLNSQVLNDNTGTYTPNANDTGVDFFTFKVNDGEIDSNISTVLVGISNSAPNIDDIDIELDEDTIGEFTLTEVDAEGDTLSYILVNGTVTSGNNGQVELISDRQIRFTPTADWNGNDTFLVKSNDKILDGNETTINVTVNPINDIPRVSNPEYGINEDTTLGPINNFLNNLGYDVDGESIDGFNVITPFQKGNLLTGGGYRYSPFDNYFGADSLIYTVYNSSGTSEEGVWKINVNPVNDAPIANNVHVVLSKNVPLTVNLFSENPNIQGKNYVYDIDNDDSELSFIEAGTVNQYSEASILVDSNGFLTITPVQDFISSGTVKLQYSQVSDGELNSDVTPNGHAFTGEGYVYLNVYNDAPVPDNISVETDEDLIVSITLSASDINGDDLTYEIDNKTVDNGSVNSTTSQTFLFTPDSNWNGTEEFNYQVFDGDQYVEATVTVTVNPVNDAPTTNDISTSTNEETALDITLDGNDIDGDDLSYVIVSDVQNGTTSLNGNILTYTPSEDFDGNDSFTYKASDGTEDSNVSTVSIVVNEAGDEFVKYFELSSSNTLTNIKQIVPTSDNGSIIVGTAESSGGNNRVYVLKLDADSNKELDGYYSIGGLDDVLGMSIDETSDGGYVVAGYGQDGSDNQAFVMKINSSIQFEWSEVFGNFSSQGIGQGNDDRFYSVQAQENGDIMVVGMTNSWIEDQDEEDILVAKISENGSSSWPYWIRPANTRFSVGEDNREEYSNGSNAIDGSFFVGSFPQSGERAANLTSGGIWSIGTVGTNVNGSFSRALPENGIDVAQSVVGNVTGGISGGYAAASSQSPGGVSNWSSTYTEIESVTGFVHLNSFNDGYVLIGENQDLNQPRIGIVKIDDNGANEWNAYHSTDNAAYDYGRFVAETYDGYLFVLGETKDQTTNNKRIVLLKINSIGESERF